MAELSRHYYLEHLSDWSEAERILSEVRQMEDIKRVGISDDLREMDIEADDERFTAVMDRVVNICRRVSHVCELHYKFM